MRLMPYVHSLFDSVRRPAPLSEAERSDMVTSILDRAAADLRELSCENPDPHSIIKRTVRELERIPSQPGSQEEAALTHFLDQVPDEHYKILRLFKQGKSHRRIARIMKTDVASVRRSLVTTYTNARWCLADAEQPGAPQSVIGCEHLERVGDGHRG